MSLNIKWSIYMRELSLTELEDVSGGVVWLIPAGKAVVWAASAVAAGVGAYYGGQAAGYFV